MNKMVSVGVKYIRASAFLVLFLLVLYIVFALGGLLNGTFYSIWGILSYLLLQVLLPLYGGILVFFILYLLAMALERVLLR